MIYGLLLEADYRRVSSAGEEGCVSTPITSSLAGLSQRFGVVNENTIPPPHGGTAMGHGGEFNQPPANPLQAGFFVIGQSRQITSSRGEAPSEFFCWRLHRLPLDMTLLPHQACKALKRKPMAMGMRAPPAPSIVGWFCQLPELPYGGGLVAPPVCHLALVAARALLAVIGEDAQSDSKHATTRDGPEAVKPVGKWPRYGEQGLPPHVGRSVEPARYKPCSTVQRSLIPVRRL